MKSDVAGRNWLFPEDHVMANGFRFGRRLKLPSTVEIKHELRMMMLADT
jgi:hypothetical protein